MLKIFFLSFLSLCSKILFLLCFYRFFFFFPLMLLSLSLYGFCSYHERKSSSLPRLFLKNEENCFLLVFLYFHILYFNLWCILSSCLHSVRFRSRLIFLHMGNHLFPIFWIDYLFSIELLLYLFQRFSEVITVVWIDFCTLNSLVLHLLRYLSQHQDRFSLSL